MTRGERRARTEKVARRRFENVKRHCAIVNEFGANVPLPQSDGFFKKANGFTDRKQSSRLWRKIQKRKRTREKDNRRNGPQTDLD